MSAAWAAIVACKAVLTAAQARFCRSIEFDLSISSDGVFFMSHEPVDRVSPEVRARLLDFDAFVAGLRGVRFDMVNVDLKERSLRPGDGRLSVALDRRAKALAELAAQTNEVIATSPVPSRYAELERWVKRTGSKMRYGLEQVDYTAADAVRWRLPMSRWEAWALPLARWASLVYEWWRGTAITIVSVQERTAALMHAGGRTVVCWSRDPASGPPPAVCRWTERALDGASEGP